MEDIKEQNNALVLLRACSIKITTGNIHVPNGQLSQPIEDAINILIETGLFKRVQGVS